MSVHSFDIDIDVKPNTKREKYGICAMMYDEDKEKISIHPSGIYLSDVPVDEHTGHSAIDYKTADSEGYLKVDILTNSAYDSFKSKEQITDAIENHINWDNLYKYDVVKKLPHIANHYDLIRKIQPRSVEELADTLALIRPSKIKYIDAYIENKEKVRLNLYRRPTDGSPYFKKSHAISYAVMILCSMYSQTSKHGIVW